MSGIFPLFFTDTKAVDAAASLLSPKARQAIRAEISNGVSGLSVVLTRILGQMYWAPTDGEVTIEQWCEWLQTDVIGLFEMTHPRGARRQNSSYPSINDAKIILSNSPFLWLQFVKELEFQRKQADPVVLEELRKYPDRVKVENGRIVSGPELEEGNYLFFDLSHERDPYPYFLRTVRDNGSVDLPYSGRTWLPLHRPGLVTSTTEFAKFNPKKIHRQTPLDLLD